MHYTGRISGISDTYIPKLNIFHLSEIGGQSFDAEDLTQDVFLSAYKNLSRFDGTYEKPGSARSQSENVWII